MTQHTPGPWRRGQEGNMRIYGPDGQGDHSGPVADIMHRMTSAEQQANALLIAAAPDLLAALKLVHDKVLSEYHSQDSYVRQQVEAAIARAEGKTDE